MLTSLASLSILGNEFLELRVVENNTCLSTCVIMDHMPAGIAQRLQYGCCGSVTLRRNKENWQAPVNLAAFTQSDVNMVAAVCLCE